MNRLIIQSRKQLAQHAIVEDFKELENELRSGIVSNITFKFNEPIELCVCNVCFKNCRFEFNCDYEEVLKINAMNTKLQDCKTVKV